MDSLTLFPPSSEPWKEITADLIIELPPSQGFNAILVVVNHFMKQAHFILTTSNLSAEGAAKLFRDNIWKDHGWPQKIITD
jgi:hypothetical protein